MATPIVGLYLSESWKSSPPGCLARRAIKRYSHFLITTHASEFIQTLQPRASKCLTRPSQTTRRLYSSNVSLSDLFFHIHLVSSSIILGAEELYLTECPPPTIASSKILASTSFCLIHMRIIFDPNFDPNFVIIVTNITTPSKIRADDDCGS